MNKQQTTLSNVVLKLAKRIIKEDIQYRQRILIRLLQRIDPVYFRNLDQDCGDDYEVMTKIIVNYYQDELKIQVKSEFLIKGKYVEKFVHSFQLILYLAMNQSQTQKEKYLEEIINMGEKEKQILMPFVSDAMSKKFVGKISETDEDFTDFRDEENEQLRKNYDVLYQKYLDIKQSYDSLKSAVDNIQFECHNLFQEKYDFMGEIGLNPSSTFLEAAEKYKTQIRDFEMEVQKLTKELQLRENSIIEKNEQIKILKAQSGKKSFFSDKEAKELLEKNEQLDRICSESMSKINTLKDEKEKNKEFLNNVRQELDLKNEYIKKLQSFKDKYTLIKGQHQDFKRNVVKKFGPEMIETFR